MDKICKYAYNSAFLLVMLILYVLVCLTYPFVWLHDRIRYG